MVNQRTFSLLAESCLLCLFSDSEDLDGRSFLVCGCSPTLFVFRPTAATATVHPASTCHSLTPSLTASPTEGGKQPHVFNLQRSILGPSCSHDKAESGHFLTDGCQPPRELDLLRFQVCHLRSSVSILPPPNTGERGQLTGHRVSAPPCRYSTAGL